MKRLALTLLLAATAVVSPSCSDETIVLAEVPAIDGGGSRSDRNMRRRCLTTAECDEGSFCDRHQCDEPAGTCEPYPVSCGGEESPVCGCDGITYWNDCLRHAAGVAGSSPGECSVGAISCDDFEHEHECPAGATCARLGGFGGAETCGQHTKGRCWVLPATCPTPTRPDRWDECAPPDRALHCKGTCDAIKSGKRFTRASQCQ